MEHDRSIDRTRLLPNIESSCRSRFHSSLIESSIESSFGNIPAWFGRVSSKMSLAARSKSCTVHGNQPVLDPICSDKCMPGGAMKHDGQAQPHLFLQFTPGCFTQILGTHQNPRHLTLSAMASQKSLCYCLLELSGTLSALSF